jgi:hypothetical protein
MLAIASKQWAAVEKEQNSLVAWEVLADSNCFSSLSAQATAPGAYQPQFGGGYGRGGAQE